MLWCCFSSVKQYLYHPLDMSIFLNSFVCSYEKSNYFKNYPRILKLLSLSLLQHVIILRYCSCYSIWSWWYWWHWNNMKSFHSSFIKLFVQQSRKELIIASMEWTVWGMLKRCFVLLYFLKIVCSHVIFLWVSLMISHLEIVFCRKIVFVGNCIL